MEWQQSLDSLKKAQFHPPYVIHTFSTSGKPGPLQRDGDIQRVDPMTQYDLQVGHIAENTLKRIVRLGKWKKVNVN